MSFSILFFVYNLIVTRVYLGDPPFFLEFYDPLPTPFYCIFKKEFSEIWSFMSGIFLRKTV